MSKTLRAMHFDDYLKTLNQISVPTHERDAAVNTYERLRTALVIASTVMEDGATPELVAAVFNQVCAESRVLEARKGFSLPEM